MSHIQVSLNLPAHRFLAYYQGTADEITAEAFDGRIIRFPARVLRPYLTQEGIKGTFVIEHDNRHKFLSIKRIDAPSSS